MTHANRRSLRVFTALTALLLTAAVILSLTGEETVRPAGAAAAIPVSGDWGLSFQNEGQPPVGNAAQEELAQYGAYYLGNCAEKVIYLTFDCGYENGYTEPILDALKKHNAPAAFFVVGNMVETAPDIIRRMARECNKAVELVDCLVDGAFGLDQDQFKARMTEMAATIADKVDVIVFAQGSMAYCEEYIAEKFGKVVVSSPRFGAAELKKALIAKGSL